jgi:hypothetical protein
LKQWQSKKPIRFAAMMLACFGSSVFRSVSWHALKGCGSRQEAIATNQREPAWQLAERIKLKIDRKGPHGFLLFRQG